MPATTRRPPTYMDVLWDRLLEVLAQLDISFQVFSQKLHQHCSTIDLPPDDMWIKVLTIWKFDDCEAELLMNRIKAFGKDYEKATQKIGPKDDHRAFVIRTLASAPPEDPGPICQDPDFPGASIDHACDSANKTNCDRATQSNSSCNPPPLDYHPPPPVSHLPPHIHTPTRTHTHAAHCHPEVDITSYDTYHTFSTKK